MQRHQYLLPAAACLIIVLIATCAHSSLKQKEEKKTTIASLPNEIMANIFLRLAFFDVRYTLAKVSKNWKNIAYMEELQPTKLRLNYDSESYNNYLMIPNENSIMQPNRAISYNKVRILEINAKKDFDSYMDLFSFAEQEIVGFDELEYLKITMEWTSSNDNVAYWLARLLKKAGKLRAFDLEWTDDTRNNVLKNDNQKSYIYFWEILRSSGVKDIKFKIYESFAYYQGKTLYRKPVPFFFSSYIFKYESAFLNELRKITLKVPASWRTFQFLMKSLRESENTLEEINVDFDYFLDSIRDKDKELFSQISRCENLKKFKLNFPIVGMEDYKYDYLKYKDFRVEGEWISAWNEILGLLKIIGNDIFFELKTSVSFISHNSNLWIYGPRVSGDSNYITLKGLSLHDDFNRDRANIYRNSIRYKDEVESLINNNPKLEKFKIVNEFHDANLGTVQQFLGIATKITELKELTIYYRQSKASFKEIYESLKYFLFYHFSKINRLTIRVTSSQYLVQCDDIEERFRYSGNLNERDLYWKENYDQHVGGDNVLTDSEIHEMKTDLPLFNVHFSMYSKHRKNDSHLLIFERKNTMA